MTNTERLAAMVTKATGAQVRIDAGNVGLVMYGASASHVARGVKALLPGLLAVDAGANVSQVGHDADEEAAFAHFAVVAVAWDKVAA